ncbi:hypothetical protein OPT61_g3084 [Boeremia exigua]|uniref:Uncharacterized protein n=1 Tax=Boeremia exigua TaxID=749465 RepID=A0ACC2IJ50_9PLEO|nr:hypothetical protein OPT61_g3084 [Boeremia exigua]
MLARSSGSSKQLTLMLHTSASAYMSGGDASSDLAFVAQYDTDNLLFSPTGDTATVDCPSARYHEIARNPIKLHVDALALTTLTLKLKQTAPIWYSHLAAMVPNAQPNAAELFNELLFDGRKASFTGFPVADYYSKHFKQGDWTVFGPLGAKPSHKRLRADSNPPPSPPTYKRRAADKEQEKEQEQTQVRSPSPLCGSSPTERDSSPTEWTTSAVSEDSQLFNIALQEHAVEDQLPAVVERLLPKVLEQLLANHVPFHLQKLLVVPSALSSTPPGSSTSNGSQLTALGATFVPHLAAHLRPQLRKLQADALAEGATDRLSTGALEIEEALANAQGDLVVARDEVLKEIEDTAGKALADARERALNFCDEVDDETIAGIEKRITEAGDRVGKQSAGHWLALVDMRVAALQMAVIATWGSDGEQQDAIELGGNESSNAMTVSAA